MTLVLAFAAIFLVAAGAIVVAFRRAGGLRAAGRLHSLPIYHGLHAGLWAAVPALILLAAWAPVQSRLVHSQVLASAEGQALPADSMQRESILHEAREIARGQREAGLESCFR
jgi:phosphate transport system permease protein